MNRSVEKPDWAAFLALVMVLWNKNFEYSLYFFKQFLLYSRGSSCVAGAQLENEAFDFS